MLFVDEVGHVNTNINALDTYYNHHIFLFVFSFYCIFLHSIQHNNGKRIMFVDVHAQASEKDDWKVLWNVLFLVGRSVLIALVQG